MSYRYTPKSSIVIPLKNSQEDEIIEIDFSELPDGEEVLQILKGEKAALHYWLDLALEYYKQGMVDEFVKILEQSGDEASLDYPNYENDQMRALDMLAAHYVLQGNKERNKEKRKEWFTRATLLYTAADKIVMYDQNHLLGRAYFCLLEGNKVEQADAQFNFVMNQSQNSEGGRAIPAMMGKACISFNRKEYKTALHLYKRCLKQNPNCPADVRVGMGYCFARLGHMDKAKLAFERALQIDPTNVPSIIALAVLELNSGTPDNIRNGIQALGQAYLREPENPMVLNHLANHFFYRQDIEKTHNLASAAHQLADNDAMRAESIYHLARCYHKKEDYHHAFQFYYQATTLTHPKFVLPYYGLGQIYIYREEYENAITAFEKVLKMAPNDLDTLAVLGSLYTNVPSKDPMVNAERREKAREYLTKVVDSQTDRGKPGSNVEALIELAQLQEQQDPQASLGLYLRVANVLKDDVGVDIPVEILNNIGSLYFMLNHLDESKQYFQEARNCILAEGAENLNDEATALLITVSYNLGRVNEQLCLYDEAERLYRNIIRQRPNYMDCILRLGCLVRNKGDLHNASLLFKESMSVNPNSPDPWTLIGNMHMAKEEWGPAQKKFEHILKLTNNTDVYSFVALGNIWLEMLFTAKTHEKDGLYRERAINYYAKALRLRPHNIWAANGIGCVLAHKGNMMDARDIFSQVREATADFADVWINVAHIYMEQKQFVSALQMYKNCMTKFGRHNDVQLISYIARAYWKAGKLAECRDCIEKIIIEEPDKLVFRFNHAVILQKMATTALQDEKSKLIAVTNAVEDLKIAERTFKHIASTPPEIVARAKYISRTVCANEAQSCMDLLKQAQTYLQRAQAKDEEERRQRELQEEQRRRLMALQAEEMRRRQEEKLMELEKLKQLRQDYVDKTREILKLPQIREEKKVRLVGRKRREGGQAEDFVNDDSSDLGEYEMDEEERGMAVGGGSGRKGAGGKHRRRVGPEGASGGSEDEEIVERRRSRKEKARDRKRRDRELDEQVPARLRGKIKSKAYLSSSSSSASSPAQSGGEEEEKSADEQGGGGGSDKEEEEGTRKKNNKKKKQVEEEEEKSEDGEGRNEEDEEEADEKKKTRKRRVVESDDEEEREEEEKDEEEEGEDKDEEGEEGKDDDEEKDEEGKDDDEEEAEDKDDDEEEGEKDEEGKDDDNEDEGRDEQDNEDEEKDDGMMEEQSQEGEAEEGEVDSGNE